MLPLRLLVRASWCTGGVALTASRPVARRPATALGPPLAVLRRGGHTTAPGEENDGAVRAAPRSVQYKFNKRVRRPYAVGHGRARGCRSLACHQAYMHRPCCRSATLWTSCLSPSRAATAATVRRPTAAVPLLGGLAPS